MPRKLPWEIDPSTNVIAVSPTKKRKRDAPESSLVLQENNSTAAEGPQKSREIDRSPSPALLPPPSPLRQGLAGDDIFIVVEDELFLTARKFAAPLHASAYRKWKTEKASRDLDRESGPRGLIASMVAAAKEVESSTRAAPKVATRAPAKHAAQAEHNDVALINNWGKGPLADLLRGKSKLLREEPSLVGLDGVRSRTKSAILAERAQRNGKSRMRNNESVPMRDDDDLDRNALDDDYDGTTTDDDDEDLDIPVKQESQYKMSFGTQRSEDKAVKFDLSAGKDDMPKQSQIKPEISSQEVPSSSIPRPMADFDFDLFPAPRALKTRRGLFE